MIKMLIMVLLLQKKAQNRVEDLIAQGVKEGANLVLDGRGATVEGYPNGNWIGPTVF